MWETKPPLVVREHTAGGVRPQFESEQLHVGEVTHCAFKYHKYMCVYYSCHGSIATNTQLTGLCVGSLPDTISRHIFILILILF